MYENIIESHNVTKIFDQETAVQSLNMQLPMGTIFGFIGPSGSGKTTTVRMLTGFYEPTSGDLRVLGKVPTEFSKSDREMIGYLPQTFVLYPNLTVWENLNFAASFYGLGLSRYGRFKQLLDFVELTEDKGKLARDLSTGMKRRLSLAATLLHHPILLFLDEPTAGIDPILRAKFWDYFKVLQSEGQTLFVTTQYVGEAAYCDLVGVMHEGKLLMIDTPDGLRRHAYGGDLVEIKTTEDLQSQYWYQLEGLPFVHGRAKILSNREIELVVDDAASATISLVEWFKEKNLPVELIDQKAPSLDEVFVRVIEKQNPHD